MQGLLVTNRIILEGNAAKDGLFGAPCLMFVVSKLFCVLGVAGLRHVYSCVNVCKVIGVEFSTSLNCRNTKKLLHVHASDKQPATLSLAALAGGINCREQAGYC